MALISELASGFRCLYGQHCAIIASVLLLFCPLLTRNLLVSVLMWALLIIIFVVEFTISTKADALL